MPDPQAPSGSIRLGRVAGVPVYLDRTWLILGAFIAWTGWQAGRDLGTTTGIAYAGWLVLGILTADSGTHFCPSCVDACSTDLIASASAAA